MSGALVDGRFVSAGERGSGVQTRLCDVRTRDLSAKIDLRAAQTRDRSPKVRLFHDQIAALGRLRCEFPPKNRPQCSLDRSSVGDLVLSKNGARFRSRKSPSVLLRREFGRKNSPQYRPGFPSRVQNRPCMAKNAGNGGVSALSSRKTHHTLSAENKRLIRKWWRWWSSCGGFARTEASRKREITRRVSKAPHKPHQRHHLGRPDSAGRAVS